MRLLKIFFTLLVFNKLCCCFNIDEQYPYIKQGNSSTFFGISVAQHIDSSNSWILVGAPQKDALKIISNSSSDSGYLYKCPLTSEINDCEEVKISKKIKSSAKSSSFGFSVASQGIKGFVLVCSNRWNFIKIKHLLRDQILKKKPKKKQYMSGSCFLLDESLDMKQELNYSVISKYTDTVQDDRQHCGLGFTSSFGNNDTLILGAPGCYDGRGSAIVFNINRQNTVQVSTEKEINYQTIRVLQKEDLIKKFNYDQYLGYSVSISKKNPSVVAVGMNRANDTGCIVVKDTSKPFRKSEKRICGNQVGASFGASLQLVDINGDGLDDLLVGAPNYFDKHRKFGGALYVYFGTFTEKLFEEHALVSNGVFRSGFGSTISNIGDINYDGISDVAVAAPMQEFGIGVIYIYNGQKSFSLSPSQVIKGSSMKSLLHPHLNVSGFGYSISGGLSFQGNGLVDLSVGSLSGTVFNFKTRSVVHINVISNTSLKLLNLHTIKNVQKNHYTSSFNRTSMTFFELSICLKACTKPKVLNDSLDVFFSIMLDSLKLKRNSRATFSPGSRQRHFNSSKNINNETNELCFNKTVYILPDVIDKLSPIIVNITVEKVEISNILKTHPRNDFNFFKLPILDKTSKNYHLVVLNISKNCGEDNICQSEFSFNASLVERLKKNNSWNYFSESETSSNKKLILGPKKEVGVYIKTWNKKEDAHQALLYLQFPKSLSFNQAISVNNSKKILYFCQEMFELGNKSFGLVQCNIGNPFKKGNKSFIVKFNIKDSLAEFKKFDISVWSNTTSTQQKFKSKTYSADVFLTSKININGFVRDRYRSVGFSGNVVGQSAIKNASGAGLYLLHEYEIENSGLSSVKDLNIEISWPNQLQNRKWLFYYLNTNLYNSKSWRRIVPGFSCKSFTNVTNPLNLKYEESRFQKRSKRVVQEKPENSHTNSSMWFTKLNKQNNKKPKLQFSCPSYPGCLAITCKIDEIPIESKRTIVISSVVWNSTFIEEYRNTYQSIELVSTATLHINHSKYIFSTESSFKASVISLVVNKIDVSQQKEIDYSYIIAAACAGLLILSLIVFIFWKCGFFKRKTTMSKVHYHKAQGHQNAAAQYISRRVIVKLT